MHTTYNSCSLFSVTMTQSSWTYPIFVKCYDKITKLYIQKPRLKIHFLSLSVCACIRVCVCEFQPSESRSASAIRAWMISQASLPYPPLKWESHSYCVPPPLIMFSNDSAKRQGIPAACHQPAQKCADGVITGAINAHHPQLSCPTCAFLFVWEGRGEHRLSTLSRPTQPTESRNTKALICAAVPLFFSEG